MENNDLINIKILPFKYGDIHLIIGCMFSGKTSELINTANRLKSINKKVLFINYFEDVRYSSTKVSTHDNIMTDCIFVEDLNKVDCKDYKYIFINEGQFFKNLKDFCLKLSKLGKEIYICGLDGDFEQKPFGEILDLIPYCSTVKRLSAYCKICNDPTPAFFTIRLSNEKDQKVIGSNNYIPVCRFHLYCNTSTSTQAH